MASIPKPEGYRSKLERELAQALEQQAATSAILRAISSSPTGLQTVLMAVAENAARLCDADVGQILRIEDDLLRVAASYGPIPSRLRGETMRITRGSVAGRAVVDRQMVHVRDLSAELDTEFPDAKPYSKLWGHRTVLAMPLLREEVPIGAIFIRRTEVRPFSDKQIEVLRMFADKAVIAIENARLFHEIKEKGRQLEIASLHKSQFLANMSHELRTPLNAILGYTELILDNIYGEVPDKIRDVLKRVEKNGRHLLDLINEVLDISKMEAGRLTLSLGDYFMGDVVQTVSNTLEALAAEKRIALKVTMPADLPLGRGDERRLTQVLLNLVGNAIKFTEMGEVKVEVQVSDGAFLVSVADTGPGIAPDDQQRIFEEFRQIDSSTTRTKGGTGLGLSIAKRIIELHGGLIWVESRLGEGSTFRFIVPRRVSVVSDAARADVQSS